VQDCELVSADAPDRSVEQPAATAGADFPRAARLLKHSDFERVYKQGRRHFSSHMTVFYLRRAEGDSSQGAVGEKGARVGFTVGKVLGGAVVRNRIKRRLREAVRLRRAVLKSVGAVDVVINPKKSASAIETAKLEAEIERAFAAVQQGKGVAASETPRRPRVKAKSR